MDTDEGGGTLPGIEAAAADLGRLFEQATADAGGRIRVEDLLSAAAAVCGEAVIAAAGEIDPEEHDLTPGQAVLSHRVNGILMADAATWNEAGDSVFGRIHRGAVTAGYVEADFPPIDEIVRRYVESIASNAPRAWGYVPLSAPDDHWPRVQPLRRAYELRRPVRQLLAARSVEIREWPAACADAVAIELRRVHAAIDPTLAIRLALETANGMAKTAPMTERHMRELAARPTEPGSPDG